MISGVTRGTGGNRLGAHVADAKEVNEETLLGASRGLMGDTIREQVAELTTMGGHSRAARPVYHMHADPPEGARWSDRQWDRHWSLFEGEFGLERAAFSEQIHTKDGREHRHREYLLVRPDGTTNPMRNDFARREKLSRIMEHETGAPFVKGAFNKKVAEFLHRDGRGDVAAAMERAGLLEGPKPRAALTPRERAQMERTGVDPRQVGAQVLAAWTASDDGRSFRQALRASGLRLAQGGKAPVVVDAAGGTHPLARLLGKESKAVGLERIPAAAVSARLADLDLVPLPEGGRGRKRDLKALANLDPADIHVPEKTAPTGATGPAGREDVALPGLENPPAEVVAQSETNFSPSESPATDAPGAPDPSPAHVPAAAEAPVATGENATGPAAGGGGGPVLGGVGGGGSTPAGGDEETVEALDPTRPGDLQRYFRQFSEAERRKAKRLAQSGSKPSQDAQRKAAEAAAEFGERVRELFETASAERVAYRHEQRRAEHVGSSDHTTAQHGHRRPGAGGHDLPGDGPAPAEHPGPEGADAGRLRGPLGGQGRARSARAQAAVGTGDGERAGQDGPGDRPHRADCEQPSQAGRETGTHGRSAGAPRAPAPADRLRARREAKTFAEAAGHHADRLRALSDLLASTPERIAATRARAERRERITEALSRSDERLWRGLARAPHPDPASRDPDILAEGERARVQERAAEARTKAETARAAAAETWRRLGILGRLGLPTADRRETDALELAAEDAEDGADEAERRLPEELREANRRALARAELREGEQSRWERRWAVQQARREERGNDLVREALRNGDQEVERAAAEDLDGAREELLRREEEQRQRAEQERREKELREQREREVAEAAEPEFEHAGGARRAGRGAPAPAPALRR